MANKIWIILVIIVVIIMMQTGKKENLPGDTLVLENPSFEVDDIWSSKVSYSSIWYSEYTDVWSNLGTTSYKLVRRENACSSYSTMEVWQDVDLTGVDSIKFQAHLENIDSEGLQTIIIRGEPGNGCTGSQITTNVIEGENIVPLITAFRKPSSLCFMLRDTLCISTPYEVSFYIDDVSLIGPTPPVCTDECTTSGEARCNGDIVQYCNPFYDIDTCLEWGGDDFCNWGCTDGQCQPKPLGDTVIFRTNNIVGTPYQEPGGEGFAWIAVDLDGDGLLEGFSAYGIAHGMCSGRGGDIIAYTPEGYEVRKEISYGWDVLICGSEYNDQDVEMEDGRPEALLAELSTAPTEPYASNGQEMYSDVNYVWCSDGTFQNTCTANPPEYCDGTGTLIDSCNDCGCPVGEQCTNNICQYPGANPLLLKDITDATGEGMTLGQMPNGALRLQYVEDDIAPFYWFGDYDSTGYIDADELSSDDRLRIWVVSDYLVTFNQARLSIDYISDLGARTDFNISFPDDLSLGDTFYVADTGETYYDVELTNEACTIANGCVGTQLCTIPGDTAPACNGIDRTELGNIAQQWMDNPTSQLRTDLGLAAQDWINHGGIE